jgi:hypothetical protein
MAAGRGIRLTTLAILPAVRSCRSRPGSGRVLRRGSSTVTWVPGWQACLAASSPAACSIRRGGEQMQNVWRTCGETPQAVQDGSAGWHRD